MPKKKVSVEVPAEEADKVVAAVEAAESDAAPTVEDVQEPTADTTAPAVDPTPAPETPATPEVAPEVPDEAPVLVPEVAPKGLTAPVDGQLCYYVWDDKSQFVASFHADQYKGEEFKYAKELADQHEGWYVS